MLVAAAAARGAAAAAPPSAHGDAGARRHLYLKTFLSGSFVKERLARGSQPQRALRRAAAGCDRALVEARVGAANAALLFRVRPPALTGADARQVTVLMGRL